MKIWAKKFNTQNTPKNSTNLNRIMANVNTALRDWRNFSFTNQSVISEFMLKVEKCPELPCLTVS
jgi:hypothetical protein